MYLWEGTHVIGSTIKTAYSNACTHNANLDNAMMGIMLLLMVILQALA
jgi:hypothetical protein